MAVQGLPVEYDQYGNNIFENGTNALAYIQNKANNNVKNIVNDSSDISFDNIQSILDSTLSDSTKDYLMQYSLGEQSAKNAFNREMMASNTQYQRAVEDLRKAGLNPFLALDSLRGSSPSSSAASISGGQYTSDKASKRTAMTSIGSILAILAAVFARTLVRK